MLCANVERINIIGWAAKLQNGGNACLLARDKSCLAQQLRTPNGKVSKPDDVWVIVARTVVASRETALPPHGDMVRG